MPYLKSLLLLFALLSPAFAHEGPQATARATEAVQALRLHLAETAKSGGRPDYTKPPASELLTRIFDLDALAALPTSQASDVAWLLDWADAANRANKLITRFGSKTDPDLAAVSRNFKDYEDQVAIGLDFQVRISAREWTVLSQFMDQLPPGQRTPVREAGRQKARHGAGEFILSVICSVTQGMKPENAHRVTSAMRDTRDVWAAFMLPEDRAAVARSLPNYSSGVADDEVRKDLAAFGGSLAAAK